MTEEMFEQLHYLKDRGLLEEKLHEEVVRLPVKAIKERFSTTMYATDCTVKVSPLDQDVT